ncbi:MAG: DNA mismatch repair protein MutS [bacterium]|nr:DNA mismatch repair protein MutS [bacterium]
MEQFTPLMRQYHQLKSQHPDAILLFRVGDFYEMFGDDAILGAKLLKLTLTKKHVGKDQTVPLAGVPHHAVNAYLARLIKQGCKVAICEQMEDPKFAKGVVKRQIVRVVTPGTVLEGSLLDEKINNYLIAINPKFDANRIQIGFAIADLSTGEFLVTEFTDTPDLIKLKTELERLSPRECLLPDSLSKQSPMFGLCSQQPALTVYPYQEYQFAYDTAYPKLTAHFQTTTLKGFGCESLQLAVGSAGAILAYLKDTQKTELSHITSIRTYSTEEYLILDATTSQNLELFYTQREKSKSGSLLGVIDETITAMGGRKLRHWLSQPLLNIEKIKERQHGVHFFYHDHTLRRNLRELLDNIYDLERLLGKIGCGVANARDVLSLKKSLDIVPDINKVLTQCIPRKNIGIDESPPSLLQQTINSLDDIPELRDLIHRAIVDDPPLSVKEGGLIKDNYFPPLDELREISRGGKNWVAQLEARERERTGIKSLKVKFNNVFGYYIEVTKPNLAFVPADYERKQTTANAERFTTPELKEWESKILGAEEKMVEMEYQLFSEIREKVIAQTKRIQQTADALALLDVLSTLAEVAVRYDYCLPELTEEPIIEIKDGRHPVIERFLPEQQFVPNDTYIDTNENRLLLITGPNMAGKSTYIRQVALISLLGQIGSYVPAKSAKLGLVDRIFTRVGAADNLLRGESTFMVEMNETANILHNATSRSLLILDEIGRGTSTFDGLSIAWAVAEYIHDMVHARTLFATHYHELTQLASVLAGMKNYNVAVREWNEKVIFLHKIVPGPCDKSYGIAVARLAGLPLSVIQRAKEVLFDLEKYSRTAKEELAATHPEVGTKSPQPEMVSGIQLSFFDFVSHPVVDELKSLDLSNLTPLQALQKLQELQEKIKHKP